MPAPLASVDRLHDRIFVTAYEWIQARSEPAGMRERRRSLVAGARGRVVEIGAGGGLTAQHYGTGVDEALLVEPSREMRDALAAAADGWARPPGPPVRIAEGTGEALPAEDASADTVVCTFVLCSVADPAVVLREAARVLKPGGRYLGLEHERSPSRYVGRAQDLVAPAWRVAGRGCRCNQDPAGLVGASPLTVDAVSRFSGPRQPWPVRPAVRIEAHRA